MAIKLEKILQKFSDENNDCFHFENKLDLFDGQASTVFKAMDELSKIVAIAFAKWIPENAYIAEDEYFYELLMNGTRVSEQELYELFTQSKEYKELMDQK